ncbi:MAG: hypothetical protein IT373_32325, partial [Polyangiaceae bacterium]|nr:hypothetical protein [Polyangiaceae bacterium]
PPPQPGSPPSERAAGAAELGVEQCAALFAECASFPDRQAAIWRRYGLADARAHQALHQDWRARFAADPALHRRWHALYEHYVAWYARAGRSGPTR